MTMDGKPAVSGQLGVSVPAPMARDPQEYTITVQFLRYRYEDDEVCEETGRNHVQQFVAELQQAYDETGIAGRFQVIAVHGVPATLPASQEW